MSREKEFERYFKRYYTPIGMYVMRYCENVDETEDIVQETFSIVWQKFSNEKYPENLRSYLYKVAHNITIDHLRCRNSKESRISLEEIGEMEVSEEAIDTSERDARLWIAISKLPARCRQIFLMSKRDGLSHADIAAELKISTKTVENQITKAFKLLRNDLKSFKGTIFFLPFL